MKRIMVVVLAFLVWVMPLRPFLAPLWAAAAFLQETSCSGNDATCTFGAAPSASNLVLVIVGVDESNTVTIEGWTPAETVSYGPVDSTGQNRRAYVFCVPGDGVETAMTIQTSGSAGTHTAAIEVSGIGNDCAAAFDDAETAADADCQGSGTQAHSLVTALTTTAAGDFIIGMIYAQTTADFTAGANYTLSPASGTEIGGQTIAEWKVAGASGSEDTNWTSAANETTSCWAAAFKATAVAGGPPVGSLGLLGVGR